MSDTFRCRSLCLSIARAVERAFRLPIDYSEQFCNLRNGRPLVKFRYAGKNLQYKSRDYSYPCTSSPFARDSIPAYLV